jgi:hypothetical protein
MRRNPVISRRRLMYMVFGGTVAGAMKLKAQFLDDGGHRDPRSWNVGSIPATELPVSRVLDLNEFTADGWTLNDVSAGPANDLLVLLAKPQWDLAYNPRKAGRPWTPRQRFLPDEPGSFRIVHQLQDGTRTIVDLLEPGQDYWFAQPLASKGYVVVSEWPTGTKPGADVYDHSGKLIRSFQVGSGVAKVQATKTGDIWVGYDLGEAEEDSIEAFGAVCFDSFGKMRFTYNMFPFVDRTNIISYCDAMNVVSDKETWLYYYTEYPVVQIKNLKSKKIWRNLVDRAPITASEAFAVDGDRLLFTGGWRDYDSLYMVPLAGESFRRFVPSENGTLLTAWWGFARGSRLYMWADDDVVYGVDASILPDLDL